MSGVTGFTRKDVGLEQEWTRTSMRWASAWQEALLSLSSGRSLPLHLSLPSVKRAQPGVDSALSMGFGGYEPSEMPQKSCASAVL